MIPDWLRRMTQTVFEWHGSLPDWLALVVSLAFAGSLCALSVWFLSWLDKPKADLRRFICHSCGTVTPAQYLVRCVTSSDPRSSGTELCRRCFDERVLAERWAHLPGIKWFDR